jgi:hypothetical protein
VYADSVNRAALLSRNSIENVLKAEIGRLRSSVSFTGVTIYYTGINVELNVNLTNTGTVKITRDTFAQIDVLLTYINNSTKTKGTFWCAYNSIDTNLHRWNLAPGTNPYPAIVNPLDWDPSKILLIIIQLPNNVMMANGTANAYLQVVLPTGSSAGTVLDVPSGV